VILWNENLESKINKPVPLAIGYELKIDKLKSKIDEQEPKIGQVRYIFERISSADERVESTDG
jgi:hypothetical protein